MATISQRHDRDGNLIGWQARVRRHGERALTKTFRRKADAQAWATNTESDIERGVLVIGREEAERTTLAEALDRFTREYIQRHHRHPDRASSVALVLRRSELATRHLASIRSVDIAGFRDACLAAGKAPGTVRHYIMLLSRLFHVAAGEWGMETLRNPCAHVTKPSIPPGRDRRLQPGEEARLMTAIAQQTRNPWLRPAVTLALETAMRQGELLAMRWEYVDLEQRTVHLIRTKNGESRTVPLSPVAVDTLRALPRSIDGRVLPTTAEALKQAWERARDRAGIEGLRFHDLRHEATSRLFESRRFDPVEIAKITGHKGMTMLMRYTHLSGSDLAARMASPATVKGKR